MLVYLYSSITSVTSVMQIILVFKENATKWKSQDKEDHWDANYLEEGPVFNLKIQWNVIYQVMLFTFRPWKASPGHSTNYISIKRAGWFAWWRQLFHKPLPGYKVRWPWNRCLCVIWCSVSSLLPFLLPNVSFLNTGRYAFILCLPFLETRLRVTWNIQGAICMNNIIRI